MPYILQTNPPLEIKIAPAISKENSDLIYAAGGGSIFGNTLVDDSVEGGNQLHGGNPIFLKAELPVFRKCDKIILTKEVIKIEGAKIERGLFVQNGNVTGNSKSDSVYLWDEIYTTPVGYYTLASPAVNDYEFSIVGNVISLKTNDVNIVPKEGDYISLQLVPGNFTKPASANMGATSTNTDWLGKFTDGINNFPVIKNTESYSFKIKEVNFTNPDVPGVTTYDYSFSLSDITEDIRIFELDANVIDMDFTRSQISANNIATIISSLGIGVWTATWVGPPGVGESSSIEYNKLTFTSVNNVNNIGALSFKEYTSGVLNPGVYYFASNSEQNNPLVGINTSFTLYLDKSITPIVGDEYAIVLLNRENTGLQKELFYDTFEQIEVHKSQLLGDPYNNTTLLNKPRGRKNYLNYNSAPYLGLRNLLTGTLSNSSRFYETPFVVFDIDKDIKDRFLPRESTLVDQTFEFHLPSLMIQDDTSNKKNILVNYGVVKTDIGGAGKYSGLFLKWDTATTNRYGYIFYDLRIIVIDHPELALAVGYNSNRNYTLPKPIINSIGNTAKILTSTASLNIIGLTHTGSIIKNQGPVRNEGGGGSEVSSNSSTPVIVIVDGNHNLPTGAAINISDVKVRMPGSNLIKSSTINGIKYIKRFFTDPITQTGERLDRFYLYDDSALSIGTIEEGTIVFNGLSAGLIQGTKLEYNYFFTYRLKNKRYSSTLPYAELISFNFATSLTTREIDNTLGSLYITIPKLTYLNFTDVDGENSGYNMEDFEMIIGEWETANDENPLEITGYKNVVVFSVQELPDTNTLPSNAFDRNYVIRKLDYENAIAKVDSVTGPYDYTTNPSGNTKYDLLTNFKHYNITNGDLSTTLNTGEGKWTIGSVFYKPQVEQYRSKLSISVKADEWNDTTNPTYNPENELMKDKYISEIAICEPDSDVPLIYAKIAPPIKKVADLDLTLKINLDW